MSLISDWYSIPSRVRQAIERPGFDASCAREIRRLSRRKAFSRFLRKFEDRVVRKIRDTKCDVGRQRDLLAELRIAAFFLDVGCEVDYQPHRKGPDMLVGEGGEEFFCEVTRVRGGELGMRWNAGVGKITSSVGSLPCDVHLVIDPFYDPERHGYDHVDVLEGNVDLIATSVVEAAKSFDGFFTELPLTSLPGNFGHLVCRPAAEGRSGRFDVPFQPVFFSGAEHKKFWDIVRDKVTQFLPGEANVLYIFVDSETHHCDDFLCSIKALLDRAEAGDDEFFRTKKVGGVKGFLGHFERLSAVVVNHPWFDIDQAGGEKRVWENSAAAVPIARGVRLLLDKVSALGR